MKLDMNIIQHNTGPVVLITAGSDGDEYDGIEAAKQLAVQFKQNTAWTGTRIVVPVINMLGYKTGVSFNPLDNKLPKVIFPGESTGTDSEKLIAAFWQQLPVKPDLWIDLHGGNTHECLTPFVWGFGYGNSSMQERTKNILQSVKPSLTVFSPWEKVRHIAAHNCLYIVCESGEKGLVNTDSISRHIVWTEKIIRAFETDAQSYTENTHIRTIEYIHAPINGYWRPYLSAGDSIEQENIIIGRYHSDMYEKECRSKHGGILLWHHKGGWVKRNQLVAAIGK